MGYRRYGYRRPRRRRRYSSSSEYQPGLAEQIVEILADLLTVFFRWIVRVVGRMMGRTASPPLSRALTDTNQECPLPAGEVPFGSKHGGPNHRKLPYRKVPGVVTVGEQAVWYSLDSAVRGKYLLFCKVRLADVVCCPTEGWLERYWFQQIGRYHVDFVICDPKTTAPLLVVELDDRRHHEELRKRQDDFKDAALRAAGVPIYRIAARRAYDPEELKRTVEQLINGAGRGAAE